MTKDEELKDEWFGSGTVGEKLRVLRQHAGYTLQGLAEASGLDKGYLSRIENNLVPPPAGKTWDAYATALLEGLEGTADYELTQNELAGIAASSKLSMAAVAQVLRDYPQLQRLVQFAVWVGLTKEECHEIDEVSGHLINRFRAAAVPTHVRGHRPIMRERRSSTKADVR